MTRIETTAVLQDVQTLFRLGTIQGLTDAQLLERFRSGSDQGAELAFAGLVARHGSMVLGVCRRALRDPNDVADAFQATFLVLVRKAQSVQAGDSLGRWLYGVSRRVAVRARRTALKRSSREVDRVDELAVQSSRSSDGELAAVLDEEIHRLPERYRAVVVLCDLDGLTQDEAARQLQCAVGTVKSRLSRGRDKLRSRLIRRGVAPAAATLCGEAIAAVVPAAMVEATVNAAIGIAAGHAGVSGLVSAHVAELTQGAIRSMFITKLQIVLSTMTVLFALATGAGVMAMQDNTPQKEQGRRSADQEAASIQAADKPTEAAQPAMTATEDLLSKEEERLDRIDELEIEIEMLSTDLDVIKNSIAQTSQTLRLALQSTHFTAPVKPEGVDPAEKRLHDQSSRREELRKFYLEKSKELRRKQRELEKLIGDRTDQTERANESRPTPSFKGVSSSAKTEQRLSDIERRLDEIMKLLKASKR